MSKRSLTSCYFYLILILRILRGKPDAYPEPFDPDAHRGTRQAHRRKKLAIQPREGVERMKTECKIGNCQRPVHARGMCIVHYSRWRKAEKKANPQQFRKCLKCNLPVEAKGLCRRHYREIYKEKKKIEVIDKRIIDQWLPEKAEQYIESLGLPDVGKKAEKVPVKHRERS